MDGAEFHALVYHVVRQIPYGKVTSYGHVAKLIGMPRHARHVGQALKFLGPDSDVPWQRVISSAGKISSRGPQTEGADRQRMALEDEGVTVQDDMRISWTEYGWFPEEKNMYLDFIFFRLIRRFYRGKRIIHKKMKLQHVI